MNENLDLFEILKDCPRGQLFYSPLRGVIAFDKINDGKVRFFGGNDCISFYRNGNYLLYSEGECMVFPSKEQRDWSKYKSECEFKPFEKVLVRDSDEEYWQAALFSHFISDKSFPYFANGDCYLECIPYEGNEYLLGTTDKQ